MLQGVWRVSFRWTERYTPGKMKREGVGSGVKRAPLPSRCLAHHTVPHHTVPSLRFHAEFPALTLNGMKPDIPDAKKP